MSGIIIGLAILVALIAFILFGTHVGLALAFLSTIGMWLLTGDLAVGISILGTTAFEGIREYTFGVLPLFVIMGVFLSISGAGADMYDFANLLLRRVKGGLGHATVLANAVFAAATGSSLASAALFTKISYPEMMRLNYSKRFALGTVAGTSVLGMLIPPSNLMIVYGMLTEQSIGQLFIAGVMPGILLAALFCLMIALMAILFPAMVGGTAATSTDAGTKESLLAVFIKPIPICALIVLVLGGIYGGFFTPTEAGAIGALGAILIGFMKGIGLKGFWRGLLEAANSSCIILFLIIVGQMFSRMLALTGLIQYVSGIITGLGISPTLVILIFILVIGVLGAFLESTSILLITMPLMAPVAADLGLDLIWFGVIAVLAVEMGLITPPFGICVFAVKSIVGDQVALGDIFIGALPFLAVMFICLMLLLIFPSIVLWLPSMM